MTVSIIDMKGVLRYDAV